MPSRGEAGRRGDRVRSDCWIAVEMRESGGLAVDVQSKVNTLKISNAVAWGTALAGVGLGAAVVVKGGEASSGAVFSFSGRF